MIRHNPRITWTVIGISGAAWLIAAIGWGVVAAGWFEDRPAYLDLPLATVERADVYPSIRVSGDVEAVNKTTVECKLEAYDTYYAVITELIEDGTMVEKGQVLARLDSTNYQTLVDWSDVALIRARAEAQKAQLNVHTTELALEEYTRGRLKQYREDYRSQIVLHESDVQRQKDRLEWVEKMVAKGYQSRGERLEAKAKLESSALSLAEARRGLANLDDYNAPLEIKRMEAAIANARSELSFQRMQAAQLEQQVQSYRDQVEACTIVAPHDGMVIYASANIPYLEIEVGAWAWNSMPLFFLPDLKAMEITAEVPESMIHRVRTGQSALVRVNSLPDLQIKGHVSSIDPLPSESRYWSTSSEIRNFLTKITLHSTPPRIMPGMSAVVEIEADPRRDSLIVPSTAITIQDGLEIVYLVGVKGLERRVVRSEAGDIENLLILEGLAEGERVIRNPSDLDRDDALAAVTTTGPPSTSSEASLIDLESVTLNAR